MIKPVNPEWIFHNDKTTLITKSSKPNIHGDSFQKNNLFYNIWEPFSSKLAAGIFNGLEIFPILKDSKILYISHFPNNTLAHLSNIVGSTGKVFSHEHIQNVKDSGKDFFSYNKNISVIFDINEIISFDKSNKLDVIIVDADYDFNIIMDSITNRLKIGGFLFFVEKTTVLTEKPIGNVNGMQKYEIVQKINLANFFKDFTMIVAQKLLENRRTIK